jgi:hypothetical protein
MRYFDLSLTDQTFSEIGSRLLAQVRAAEPQLTSLTEADADRPRAPGKWSPKQILGHLTDSAANNHQRFVRAQEQDSIALPGYEQEHWVACQHYEQRPWREVIALWTTYNRHLAHVLSHIPEEHRKVRCEIGKNEPVTLSYIALDYVGHIQHHMRQILGDSWRAV